MSGEDPSEGYREWERSVATWWNTVLDDPAFVRNMGDAVGARGRVMEASREQVDRAMEAWHLPSKRDLVRLAKIASLLEDRLVALEDRVADALGTLERIEKEALKARIQAAETRVLLDERLAAIDAKLDRLLG